MVEINLLEEEILFHEMEAKRLKGEILKELNKKTPSPKVYEQVITDNFSIYRGDSIEVIKGITSDSIHYTIFSPPFSNLFCYSSSIHDLGNSTDEQFYEHFDFLAPEMLRVTIPGRLLTFHCSDIPAMKERDGYMGLKDLPGKLIAIMENHGWIYFSRHVIWKDPLIEATRTKALGLAHKQVVKDSSRCRAGLPDYLVTMRKPGDNPFPISRGRGFEEYIGDKSEPTKPKNNDPAKNKYSHTVWQRYASPIWMDIAQGDTLNIKLAREKDDERHICLAHGSLVLTKQDGYLPIEDIEIGSLVLTHNGRWMPVTGKKCNGMHPIVSVHAQGVANLHVTPDHELWCRSPIGPGRWPSSQGGKSWEKMHAANNSPQWKPAIETKSGYVNLRLPPVEDSPLTANEWWIVGRWLGDGHRGGHRHSGKRGGVGQFLISCSHAEAESLVARLGKYAGHVGKSTASQIALKELRPEVRDVLNRCGNGAINKKLPGEAALLCPEKAEALLSGYLSADGHYTKKYNRYSASSVSRSLLLGMALIAQRARGVVASVYAGRPGGESTIQGRIVNTSQDWIFAFRNSTGYRQSGWIGEDGAWKKVRRIEECGEAQVWDISVAEDASFTAEGTIVKNCPLQLPVIARCLELWSLPGETVASWFAGIGSEGVKALQMKRKFIGVELKKSYFDVMTRYLKSCTSGSKGFNL